MLTVKLDDIGVSRDSVVEVFKAFHGIFGDIPRKVLLTQSAHADVQKFYEHVDKSVERLLGCEVGIIPSTPGAPRIIMLI